MCVCVCMCMCVCVCVCALNLENMNMHRICKRLGPVRVRRSKYPLFLLENHHPNFIVNSR